MKTPETTVPHLKQRSCIAPEFVVLQMPAFIPMRWRAVILITGTIVFFPLIISAMMIGAVIHDMPKPRRQIKDTWSQLLAWTQRNVRIPQPRQAGVRDTMSALSS